MAESNAAVNSTMQTAVGLLVAMAEFKDPSQCEYLIHTTGLHSVMNCPFMNCDWQLMRLGLTVLRCILAHRPEKITVIVNNHGGEFVYRLLKR
ncbi:unnamed protein product [Dibothriocephalus latus]|uniref:Uncharacterized protein n=1 Tax=Dibothriocephalus latus TaxID=60516 RepID=A0A3P7LI85_DIBLA|nr:unnamed protein product [Dibothriocephalus latus]